jgi:hypothetical protein
MIRSHLINPGARPLGRFTVDESIDFGPQLKVRELRRRKRRVPFAIYETGSNDL